MRGIDRLMRYSSAVHEDLDKMPVPLRGSDNTLCYRRSLGKSIKEIRTNAEFGSFLASENLPATESEVSPGPAMIELGSEFRFHRAVDRLS